MIKRLLSYLACPECHHPSLSIKILKLGNKISYPLQRQFDLKNYLLYRDNPNNNLLLKWQNNDGWIVWPDNTNYLVNLNSSCPLVGEIICTRRGTYSLSLRGILNNQNEISVNKKSIGNFLQPSNNLLQYIHLGKISLKKGINYLKIKPLNFSQPDYIHNGHIFLNQSFYNKNTLPPPTKEKSYNDILEGILYCNKCGSKFPIVESIPILLKKHLLSSYISSHKIPSRIKKIIINTGKHINTENKGIKYKISEMSNPHVINLATGSFEGMINLPFFQQDSQRSQERLLSFSLLAFLLNPKPNEIIFDSAAGIGWTSKFLAKLGCEVISSDINFDYIKNGKKNTEESYFHRIVSDSEDIPIIKNLVDSVFSYDSFHHMPNKIKCIKNFSKILKYGGRAVFYEPKAVHNTNYYSQMIMDKFSILEEGFTEEEFIGFLKDSQFKTPIFHKNPYFKDGNVIFVDKTGYKNVTSLSPGILGATFSVNSNIHTTKSLLLDLTIKNTGDTIWLASKKANNPGCVYIKLSAFDNQKCLLFSKYFSLNQNVLPLFKTKKILKIPKGKLLAELEIDLCIFGLLEFQHAHSSHPLNIKL